jgi:hypothetical protein
VESIPHGDVLPRPLKLASRPVRDDYKRPPRGHDTVILDRY